MPVFIDPSSEQFSSFAKCGHKGEVVMLNLLRFNVDGGEQSYAEYGQAIYPMLQARGAEVIYQGAGLPTVIGGDEQWDEMLLVRYPAIDAFIDMVTSDEYQAIVHLRTAAVADSRLYPLASENGLG